ncbi:MAG: hypothetical protein J6Y72_03620 [Bacteroidales bacterium]|nr:hypothetical protein [Bacteroidales bacterium]MCR5697377.1 hypothetical protein [Marinilabiliaceae bacterium]
MLQKIAYLITVLLHPLLLTIYAVIYVLWGNTMWCVLPTSYKVVTTLYVSLGISLLPLISVVLLYIKHNFKGLDMTETRDRMIPLVFTAISSIITYHFITSYVAVPMPIIRMVQAQCVSTIVACIVTPFWRISLHMIACGALVVFTYIVGMSNGIDFYREAMAVFAITGFVAWARLYVQAHTPLQLVGGFVLGFSAMYMMTIF